MKIAKINNINSKISFKENYTNGTNSIDAGLMMQSKNANVNFAREKYITQQTNSVNANPITSLGYKLYRTFGYFKNQSADAKNSLNLIA